MDVSTPLEVFQEEEEEALGTAHTKITNPETIKNSVIFFFLKLDSVAIFKENKLGVLCCVSVSRGAK